MNTSAKLISILIIKGVLLQQTCVHGEPTCVLYKQTSAPDTLTSAYSKQTCGLYTLTCVLCTQTNAPGTLTCVSGTLTSVLYALTSVHSELTCVYSTLTGGLCKLTCVHSTQTCWRIFGWNSVYIKLLKRAETGSAPPNSSIFNYKLPLPDI